MAEEASLLTAPSANLQRNIDLQEQCPLFTILPAEIRSLIYTYALTDYENTTDDGQSYDRNTYWYRPGYKAGRRTATELLRSCKRIFQETWFMPFALAEHSFYLMHQDRAPPRRVTLERMRRYLATLRDFSRIQDGKDIPLIHSIRVFAQLWALEDPRRLQEVLNLEGFHPRNVTITIRYTDFWFWERNAPLHVDARWVNAVIFPQSVITIRMDFEMVDRRKKEIDFITDLAAEKWIFRRADGIALRANKDDTVTTGWTGSSTWANARWIRDESRPNEIDFYVKTVTWKSAFDGDNTFTGSYGCPNLDIPSDFIQEPVPVQAMPSVQVNLLESAGIPNDASAEEVAEAVGRQRDARRGALRAGRLIRRRPRPETGE